MVAENAIFISYRRSDSNDVTGRICDRLKAHFGADAVFIDYDDIPFGKDFPDHLQQTVDCSKVLLAIIGPAWLNVLQERIDNPKTDWVRAEIERALGQGLLVIPVLVGESNMPDAKTLPVGLQALPHLNASSIRAGADFKFDMQRLIQRLVEIVGVEIPTRLMPPQMKSLQNALLAAFPDDDEFATLVTFYLGMALNRVSRAKTYDKVVFDVIQWVNSRNKVSNLVNGALETNPDSPELLQFISSLS
ncbi:MAG: TIR domain-containing protein [Cyanobacteria bacterium P01_F01_bin.53]